MKVGTRHHNLLRSLLVIGITPFAFALAAPLKAQVIWEPVSEEQAQQDQILAPMPDGSRNEPLLPQAIIWEPVPTEETSATDETNAIVWTPVPASESVAEGSAPNTAVVWEVIPESDTPLSPAPARNLAEAEDGSSTNEQEAPPPEVIAQEAAMPPRLVPGLPPPPPLQALNRSIAYGDGLVGPDIGWRVPNGLRWSRRWFGDATVQAINRRQKGDDNFFDFGQGDGEGIVHANVLQTEEWSVGLNYSFRSLQNDPNRAGGSTGITDGMSTGFRVARAIGDTGGIAFGAEQLIQWDDRTDTGRNIYLMATKGWWLGNQGKDYPLVIANGGVGTGAFQYDNPLRFACINNVQNRTEPNFQRDNDLCWGPIGSIALVFNEYFAIFTEYNGTAPTLSASLNLTGGIPIRLTWGVSFAGSQELREDFDQYRWTFGASIGF